MSELFEHTCPACGGAISFDAASQKISCPYCGSQFDISQFSESAPAAPKTEWKREAAEVWQDTDENAVKLYICKSCGGEIMTDATTAAASCPYCGNPVVMTEQFEVAYPDAVIPFKKTKKEAMETLQSHVKSHKFALRAFSRENRLEEIKGVYVPYWFYSADVNADYEFTAQRVRTWSDNSYNYTETSHYRILRKGSLGFGNVPADGSKKLDDAISESIEPFHLSDAVPFKAAYLAGYLADRYDVSWETNLPLVNRRIKNSTEDTLRRSVKGYTTVQTRKDDTDIVPGEIKYILCPVWLLNTRYRGKKYCFAMNGQTGAFVGDLPLDRGHFLLSWLITSLITMGVIVLAIILLFLFA